MALTAATAMQYQATPIQASRKQDLRVISEMSTTKILLFLTHRHRVGLLALSNALLLAYLAYDKVQRFL